MTTPTLDPDKQLAAAVLDVLGSLSSRSLQNLRNGTYRTAMATIPAARLVDLVAKFEAVWPGALDRYIENLAQVEAQERNARQSSG